MTAQGPASEVRTLFEAWMDAVRRKDLEGVLANHGRDIVLFDVPEPVQVRGIDAYRRSWDEFLVWVTTFEADEIKVTAGNDVAFCHAIVRCAGRTETEPFAVRLTVGYEKRGGRWTVTHEHHSVPASA
jgi:uncharacterized protein (TIGR02246 family)